MAKRRKIIVIFIVLDNYRTHYCTRVHHENGLNHRGPDKQDLKTLDRREFRLPQRSHLRNLKNFVSEKSGKRCEKSGNTGKNRETGKF